MMAFILATDFDFIAYMSKLAFFFFWKLFSRQWRFWNMIIYRLQTKERSGKGNNQNVPELSYFRDL